MSHLLLSCIPLARQVREMFYHGFDNYMTHAFPHDELKPISGGWTDSLVELGNARRRMNDVSGTYTPVPIPFPPGYETRSSMPSHSSVFLDLPNVRISIVLKTAVFWNRPDADRCAGYVGCAGRQSKIRRRSVVDRSQRQLRHRC